MPKCKCWPPWPAWNSTWMITWTGELLTTVLHGCLDVGRDMNSHINGSFGVWKARWNLQSYIHPRTCACWSLMRYCNVISGLFPRSSSNRIVFHQYSRLLLLMVYPPMISWLAQHYKVLPCGACRYLKPKKSFLLLELLAAVGKLHRGSKFLARKPR